MKAISIRQPWAWLIVNGYKPIENRDRRTNIRGTVLIHASKTFDRKGWEWVKQNFPNIPMPRTPEAFLKGGIVGQTEIVGCVEESPSQWFFGKFGYELKNSTPLSFRACKGKLGFFVPDVEPEARAA